MGELVGTGAPIMNIAIMDDMWVTFNVARDIIQAHNAGRKLVALLVCDHTVKEINAYYLESLKID